MAKLAEGGFNRTFVLILRDGRQVVARVPYLMTASDYYAVATIKNFRSYEISTPEVYGYSADSDNDVGVLYVIMKFVWSSKLSD